MTNLIIGFPSMSNLWDGLVHFSGRNGPRRAGRGPDGALPRASARTRSPWGADLHAGPRPVLTLTLYCMRVEYRCRRRPPQRLAAVWEKSSARSSRTSQSPQYIRA